jgi:hypothetical protein
MKIYIIIIYLKKKDQEAQVITDEKLKLVLKVNIPHRNLLHTLNRRPRFKNCKHTVTKLLVTEIIWENSYV